MDKQNLLRSALGIGLLVFTVFLINSGYAILAQKGPPPPPANMVPINDLGTGTYLGYQGGLYPGGSNTLSGTQRDEGLIRAASIQPLDTNGNPSSSGKIVMVSAGMSNTTQEFCSGFNGNIADQNRSYWPNMTSNTSIQCNTWTFGGQAWADPAVNHSALTIVDGAQPGVTANRWADDSAAPDNPYDTVRNKLTTVGLTVKQVQIVWMKHANIKKAGPLQQGFATSEAVNLEKQQGTTLRLMKNRWPNLKMVFISTRTYGGYSLDTINPEPYAYESGFGTKWLIEDQINQMAGAGVDAQGGDLNYDTVAPWVAWGAYLWANDNNARSDGLTYVASDFDAFDGRHPSQSGEQKVGTLLLNFFKTSPYTQCWFLTGATCP